MIIGILMGLLAGALQVFLISRSVKNRGVSQTYVLWYMLRFLIYAGVLVAAALISVTTLIAAVISLTAVLLGYFIYVFVRSRREGKR